MTRRTLTPTTPKVLRRGAPAVALLALLLLGAAIPDGLASGSAPVYQQGPKLTGGEESGEGRFGRSVAISADGNTALVGGPRDGGEAGAVWVFARSGSTWTQQAKLTGGEASCACHFGRGVALTANGDTALVGAPNDDGGGAAWVFTRSGSTWTQQVKLTGAGESGSGWFGQSVALSADGSTALVGGYVDHSDTGAAWVFERAGTGAGAGSGAGATWAQQGAKLTGGAEEAGEGEFGWSVALSGEGTTALIGARKDNGNAGAAWVFERAGASTGVGADATWAQQGAKLTGGAEESGEAQFGQSVALSAAGDTALVGGFHDEAGTGAAWIFTRAGAGAGGTWAQQGAKLTGGGEAGHGYFGDAVALTPDGDTALVGGIKDGEQRGAAWLFTRTGAGSGAGTGSDAGTSPGAGTDLGAGAAPGTDPGVGTYPGVGAAPGTDPGAGATWAQQGEKLTGGAEESGRGEFGWSVAFSGDGDTALIGGIGDDKWAGAVWTFGNEPPPPGPPPPGPTPGGGNPDPGAQTQTAGGSSSGATGSTPKQGVAAYRVRGGGVVLLAKRLPTAGGRVRVRLRCTAETTCRGRLALTLVPQARAALSAPTARSARRSRAVMLGAATFSIPHGRATTVVLALDRAGRARLRARGGYLRASLAIHVVAPGPPRTHAAYAVRLVPRR